eukprot:5470080-Amphidinium_carterae.1
MQEKGEQDRAAGEQQAWKLTELGLYLFSIVAGAGQCSKASQPYCTRQNAMNGKQMNLRVDRKRPKELRKEQNYTQFTTKSSTCRAMLCTCELQSKYSYA